MGGYWIWFAVEHNAAGYCTTESRWSTDDWTYQEVCQGRGRIVYEGRSESEAADCCARVNGYLGMTFASAYSER